MVEDIYTVGIEDKIEKTSIQNSFSYKGYENINFLSNLLSICFE